MLRCGVKLNASVAVPVDPVVADHRRAPRRTDVDAVIVIVRDATVMNPALLDRGGRRGTVVIRRPDVEADGSAVRLCPIAAAAIGDVEPPPDRVASVHDRARQVPLVPAVDSQVFDDPVAARAAQPDDAVQRRRVLGIEAPEDDRRINPAGRAQDQSTDVVGPGPQAADVAGPQMSDESLQAGARVCDLRAVRGRGVAGGSSGRRHQRSDGNCGQGRSNRETHRLDGTAGAVSSLIAFRSGEGMGR